MRRVVIDTNVLVASAYNPRSCSRRIVVACEAGELVMVASPDVCGEYEFILPRAVRNREEVAQLLRLIGDAEMVDPVGQPRVVIDDPDDDKFLAAAIAGRADAVISNDAHLLEIGSYEDIPIVRPTEFCETVGPDTPIAEDDQGPMRRAE